MGHPVTPTIHVDVVSEIAGYAAMAMVFIVVLLWRPRVNRRGAIVVGVCWLILWNLEYFALGPYSFIHAFDEGWGGFPLFIYKAEYLRGAFAHAVGGGKDANLLPGGAQLFFLEAFLVQAFPSWLALAIHKALISTAAFVGTYLLARRGCGSERLVAFGLAAFVTLGSRYFFAVTFVLGVMHGLIPLLCYVIGLRSDRAASWQSYLLGVLPIAILGAISGSPPHNLPVAVLTIALVSFVVDIRRWDRVFAGMALLVVLIFANSFNHLIFLWRYSPLTTRVEFDTVTVANLQQFVAAIFDDMPDESGLPIFALSIGALTILWILRDAWRARATVMLAVSVCLGPVLTAVPWHAIGLAPLSAVSYRYLSYSLTIVFAVLAGRALADLKRPLADTRVLQRYGVWIPAAIAVAIAAFPMAKTKVTNLAHWMGIGSQGAYARIPNLLHPDWPLPKEPFRVVTIPFRLPQNYAPAYGFEAFDGYSMLPLDAWVKYWKVGMKMPDRFFHAANAALGHGENSDIWRCCKSYDIAAAGDIRLLQVANVRYIFSMVPLHGAAIRKVSGPPDDDVIVRADVSLKTKIVDYISRNFAPGPAFVYEIDGPLPRMFAAKSVRTVTFSDLDPAYYETIAHDALDRIAVIRGDAPGIRERPKNLQIQSFAETPNGYSAEVSAPNGGTLVLNAQFSPFWTVTLDDTRTVPAYQVNAIQMAVDLPADTKSVKFEYHSPTLFSAATSARVNSRPRVSLNMRCGTKPA